MACQWSGRKTQAARRNLCSARRSWITCARVANSDGERVCRRSNGRQEIKNQRSGTTKRRSRDMHVIIIPAATRANQNSRSPKSRRATQKARTSALPAQGFRTSFLTGPINQTSDPIISRGRIAAARNTGT
jgi:hypothetical protein